MGSRAVYNPDTYRPNEENNGKGTGKETAYKRENEIDRYKGRWKDW